MGVFNLGYCYACAVYTLGLCISEWFLGSLLGKGVSFVARLFCSDLPHWWRKSCRFFLAFFWLSGFLCGILVYLSAGRTLTALMRSTVYVPVSIVGMLCVTTFPFLLSAIAVFLSRPAFLLPICFGKAFLFGFVSIGIFQAFGSAGWLLRWLLLFSDCIWMPLLYWFWLHHISGQHALDGWEAVLLCALGLLVGSINNSIISPFLAGLIEI